MINAITHSRPPSYRSHISDHPVIETAHNQVTQPLHAAGPNNSSIANNTNNTANNHNNSVSSRTTTRTSTSIRHSHATSADNSGIIEHVQVAQVHAIPSSPAGTNQNSRIPDSSQASHQRNSGLVESGSPHSRILPGSGQDVSIVPVVSASQYHKTDLDYHHPAYHVKSGSSEKSGKSGQMDTCGDSTSSLYEQLFNRKDVEKRSVVTIVQTSATNSEPVIVTVSGNLEPRLNTSSDSGSDFSEIRASPAEVEILATL